MDRPHPKLLAAQAALRQGDYAACYQAAASVLHTKPGSPEANYFAGYALLKAGRRARGPASSSSAPTTALPITFISSPRWARPDSTPTTTRARQTGSQRPSP